MAVDETITCADCAQNFPFTVGEQAFFAQKGFDKKPTRCPACRAARKKHFGVVSPNFQQPRSSGIPMERISSPVPLAQFISTPRTAFNQDREMFAATCSACGDPTSVPFKPIVGKRVFCRLCLIARRPTYQH